MKKSQSAYVLTLGELQRQAHPPPPRILAPWLAAGESALVHAQPGIGKSWLTLAIALAVAAGGAVGPWAAPEPRRVMLWDGEMSAHELKQRCEALAAPIGGDASAAAENLQLVPMLHPQQTAPRYDLADASGAARVLAEVERAAPALVIFDNLTCFAQIADENSVAAVRPVLAAVDALRAAGRAVLLVHHEGKRAGALRGSSALAQPFHCDISLQRRPHAPADRVEFSLQVLKNRGGADLRPGAWRLLPDGAALRFECSTSGDAPGDSLAAAGSKRSEAVAAVRAGFIGSQVALAERLGISQQTLSRYVCGAVRGGDLTAAAVAAAFPGRNGKRTNGRGN